MSFARKSPIRYHLHVSSFHEIIETTTIRINSLDRTPPPRHSEIDSVVTAKQQLQTTDIEFILCQWLQTQNIGLNFAALHCN